MCKYIYIYLHTYIYIYISMIYICMDFHWTCFYCADLCQFLVPLNTSTKKNYHSKQNVGLKNYWKFMAQKNPWRSQHTRVYTVCICLLCINPSYLKFHSEIQKSSNRSSFQAMANLPKMSDIAGNLFEALLSSTPLC